MTSGHVTAIWPTVWKSQKLNQQNTDSFLDWEFFPLNILLCQNVPLVIAGIALNASVGDVADALLEISC